MSLEESTIGTREQFLTSVIELRPAVAVFDCDGTLWSKNAGRLFMEWSVDQGMVPKERAAWLTHRYTQYKTGLIGEAVICGDMTSVYAGLGEEELRSRAQEFYLEHVSPFVFLEMKELIEKLRAAGTEIWAVSSTVAQVIEAAFIDFGIPSENILATRASTEVGILTETILAVPTDDDKCIALKRAGVHGVYAAFGNSIHDMAMLESAQWPFAVNPNRDLLMLAKARKWPVYSPHGELPARQD